MLIDAALRRNFIYLLIGLQILLVVVVVAGALHLVRIQRENALNERLNHAVRTVQGVEEHLTQTLSLVGLTLGNLEELSGYRFAQPARESQTRLEQLQRQMPMLRSLSLADRQGRIVASSVAANVGRRLDLGGLLPEAPIERTGVLRLGAAWEGRDFADGRPTHPARPADPRNAVFFPLAQPIPGASGLVAVAAVNTDYFLNRLAVSFDPELLQVEIYDYRGALLLGNRDDLSPGSQSIDARLLARIRQDEIGAQGDAPMDGGAALLAFRASRNYPLFVVGHVQRAQALKQWRAETETTFAYVGLALLATLLMTGLLTLRLNAAQARENRLREAQRLAARVFVHSSDGIFVTAADTTILSVNPAYERITGYSAAEALGRTPRLLSSGHHSPEFYKAMWQTLDKSGEWRGEIVNRRKDGSLLTEWLTITRIADSDGKASGYIGFFMDLSKLRESEMLVRQLSTAMEQSPSSILITNLDAEIEYVNPQFEIATGYSAAEAIGRNPRFLNAQLTPPETFRTLWEQLLAGERWEGEFINRRKDGTVYYDYAKLAPIRDGSGRVTHFVGIQMDISARKAAEAALVKAKDDAEAANRAKTSFLANMSHELRTPMHGVMGMIALAKRRMADPKGIEQLDIAKLSAERLMNVLNDLLDISKIEAERMTLEQAPLQLGAIFDHVRHLLDPRAADKGLVWRTEISPELAELPFVGDALRLEQIFTNLAGNAIKFTERGSVTLRAKPGATGPDWQQIDFECVDSGIGVAPDALDRIFSPFEQADNSMTRKFGGTGLGLAISKRLVEMMGGTLNVDSTLGAGSRFWFAIRLRRRDPLA